MKQIRLKLQRVLSDPLRKPLIIIIFEILKESFRLKRIPNEYLSRFCYRKGAPSLSNYVSDQMIGHIQLSKVLHSPHSVQRLLNKLEFFHFARGNDIPTAQVIAYSSDHVLYTIDHEICNITTQGEFKSYLTHWLNKSKYQSLFIKPNDLKGGVGAFKVDHTNISDETLIQSIYTQVLNNKMLIQETLVQHPAINAINPHSINTIRIDTYQPLNGETRVIAACMRFGRAGSVVDNPGTSKGFFVKLNLETHRLEGLGQQIITFGNQTFTHHPDTHHPLGGVHIPYVNEAIELVLRATRVVKDRLIGWDICITPDGPLLIEGNHNYHIVMLEIANGGYAHLPSYQDVLKEVSLELKQS
jgi:hypothetical protein